MLCFLKMATFFFVDVYYSILKFENQDGFIVRYSSHFLIRVRVIYEFLFNLICNQRQTQADKMTKSVDLQVQFNKFCCNVQKGGNVKTPCKIILIIADFVGGVVFLFINLLSSHNAVSNKNSYIPLKRTFWATPRSVEM